MQNRRAFFGSAATLGLGSAVGATLIFQEKAGAQNRAQSDAVFNELRKELRGSVRAMRDRPNGEGARRLAATLRIGAAHAAAQGMDERLRKALRRAVDREGRDAILFREMDGAMLAAEAKDLGVRLPPLLLPPNPDLRGQVLDAMLERGFTPLLTQAAARFDSASRLLDERTGTIRQIRNNYTDDEHEAMCRQMEREIFTIEAGMIIACLFPFDGGWACALLSGSYIGYRLVMFWKDC